MRFLKLAVLGPIAFAAVSIEEKEEESVEEAAPEATWVNEELDLDFLYTEYPPRECYRMLFTATAYYSPLEDQSRYATGSVEGDRKLNGNGLLTASGAVPHVGTIAAPRNKYPFGTRFDSDDLKALTSFDTFFTVEDTGGAIKKADPRVGRPNDRIDVWMGSGEAALDAAEAFGRQKIFAVVCLTDGRVLH